MMPAVSATVTKVMLSPKNWRRAGNQPADPSAPPIVGDFRGGKQTEVERVRHTKSRREALRLPFYPIFGWEALSSSRRIIVDYHSTTQANQCGLFHQLEGQW